MDLGPVPPNSPLPAVFDVNGSKDLNNERRELIHAVRAVNAAELFGQNNELTFVLDRQTHRPLLRIVDRKTKEVVRQIPPEQVLRLAEDLGS